MATSFDAIFEDFSEELDGLLDLASISGSASAPGISSRARVAAGNGATLLLAALFEEYVRQQVKAAFEKKKEDASDFSVFPDKLPATVWRRSLEQMARKPFDEVEIAARQADTELRAVSDFCIKRDLSAAVSKALAHNENNLRPGEFNRLFKQIGIKSTLAKVCSRPSVKAFISSDNDGQALVSVTAEMEDFFRRRNEIAHAIQIGSSSGALNLNQDIEFFRTISRALAEVLDTEV